MEAAKKAIEIAGSYGKTPSNSNDGKRDLLTLKETVSQLNTAEGDPMSLEEDVSASKIRQRDIIESEGEGINVTTSLVPSQPTTTNISQRPM